MEVLMEARPLTETTPQVEIEPKLAVTALGKDFTQDEKKLTVLEGVNFSVAPGEFLSIVGPSGCGKTTLLRIIAGLEHPSRGKVELQQEDASRPVSSMVFQEASIFPWMTVAENAEYGLAMRGVSPKTRRAAAAPVLDKVGLGKFAKAYPHQLSGGMKQRCSLARAFANDPELLLMDEPFAAVDEQTRLVLQGELLRIWGETKKSVVFITHSIGEALALSDRIIVLAAHPGRIAADITVPFERPRDLLDLKADPEFGRLEREIWKMLAPSLDETAREGDL